MDDELPLPLLPSGPGVHRREVVVPPGHRIDYVAADWRGALVVVERGEIDLCRPGGGRRFGPGAVLFLEELGLAALRNPGVVDAVLAAFTRR